jgi:hypothetical protein
MAWDRQRAGYGLIGVLLLAAGIGLGRADPQRSVTPQTVPGTVTRVGGSGGEIAFRPDGSAATESFRVGGILKWQDRRGTWHDGGRPACMKPLSRRQHVTLGIASVTSGDGNPGGQLVAWIRCQ